MDGKALKLPSGCASAAQATPPRLLLHRRCLRLAMPTRWGQLRSWGPRPRGASHLAAATSRTLSGTGSARAGRRRSTRRARAPRGRRMCPKPPRARPSTTARGRRPRRCHISLEVPRRAAQMRRRGAPARPALRALARRGSRGGALEEVAALCWLLAGRRRLHGRGRKDGVRKGGVCWLFAALRTLRCWEVYFYLSLEAAQNVRLRQHVCDARCSLRARSPGRRHAFPRPWSRCAQK